MWYNTYCLNICCSGHIRQHFEDKRAEQEEQEREEREYEEEKKRKEEEKEKRKEHKAKRKNVNMYKEGKKEETKGILIFITVLNGM